MTMERGLYVAFMDGAVSIPNMLLQWYARLGLSEIDMMLIIHLIAFREKELNEFPTIEEMMERMDCGEEQVVQSIQKLMRDGWLAIDEEVDEASGIRYERYNLSGLYKNLAEVSAQHIRAEGHRIEQSLESRLDSAGVGDVSSDKADMNLFTMFEQEFGRPITPMECETIVGWLDKDSYTEELIIAALKESVFAGKVHFRYIDRILLEWSRNRVRTPDEAKDYTLRYRGE